MIRMCANLLCLTVFACVVGGQPALAAKEPSVRLLSGENLVWAYRHTPAEGKTQYRNLAYRRKVPLEGGVWVPVPLPPLRGRAVLHTTVGDNLHVFFEDGTHRAYPPIEMNWNDQAARLQIPQNGLPGNRTPLAIAGDAASGLLYALVDVATAEGIETALADHAKALADRDGSAVPHPPAPAFKLPETGFVVARYEGTRWMLDRLAPDGLSPDTHAIHLMAHDGVLTLLEADIQSPQDLTYQSSPGRDVPWAASMGVPTQAGNFLLNVGVSDSKPYMVLGGRGASSTGVEILQFADESWQRTAELSTIGVDARVLHARSSVALFGDLIVAATCDDTGQVKAGIWSADTSAPVTELSPAPLYNRPWRLGGHNTLGFVLQYGLLGAVLAALFLVRKDRFIRSTTAPSVYTLARLDARLKALLIDVAVTAPLWLPVVTAIWLWQGQGLTLAERLALRSEFQLQEVFSTWVAVGCLLGVYGMIFESARRTTLGKRLVGLEVVGEDHEPCRHRAIILRNLLRVIEFQFPPLAILVLLTPNRQRVGDLFARTLVVEARKKAVEKPELIDSQV